MRQRVLILLAALVGLLGRPGHAQDARVPPTAPAPAAAAFEDGVAELDQALTDAGHDGRFSSAIAVLSSADGRVWTQTYGLVEGAGSTPPAPDSTRYLIASVTKTMTAVCVLQLFDRGLIHSLDDPANQYLKRVSLGSFQGREITIRHLLTHTSGLRTLAFGIIRRTSQTAPASAAFVQRHTPDAIRRPGDAVVYSNAGYALLGTIIEDVTGLTLQDYMARELFAPLGMDTAILNYEVAPTIPHAKPRIMEQGGSSPMPFDANTPFLAPAGSVMATADDMAAYLSFIRDAGRSWSAGVLSAEAFQDAFSMQARNHPLANAVGLGFFITDWNGVTLIGHTGAFSGYTSYLSINPETGLGAFIATAGGPAPGGDTPAFTAYGDGARIINRAIALRPARTFTPSPLADAQSYAGTYVHHRRFSRGVARLLGLQQPMVVSADGEGFLQIGPHAGLGDISNGVVGAAGNRVSPPAVYGLPSVQTPSIAMNADRARKAHWLETPSTLYLLLIGGGALTLIGAIGGFAPIAPASGGLRVFALSPLAGLLALGGLFATLLLFYAPGESLVTHLIAGETLRVRIINICAWVVLAACGAAAFRLFFARLKPGAGMMWLWIPLQISAVSGLAALSLFVVVTGLADPRLV